METCFLSLLGFTHRTLQNTHNAAGFGWVGAVVGLDALLKGSEPSHLAQDDWFCFLLPPQCPL